MEDFKETFLDQSLDIDPTEKSLPDQSDVPPELFIYAMNSLQELIQASHASFDQSAGVDDDGNSYTITDKGSLSTSFASRNEFEDEIDNEDMMAKVKALLNSLDARSREIVEKTFGIGYEYEWDDEDIADSLGLTKTRIQQIRRAALAQMKNI